MNENKVLETQRVLERGSSGQSGDYRETSRFINGSLAHGSQGVEKKLYDDFVLKCKFEISDIL